MRKSVLFFAVIVLLSACSDSKNQTTQSSTINTVNNTVSQPAVAPQANNQSAKVFTSYTPQEAQRLIQQRKDLLIVDVRSPQELREGKIKNSILVPFWNIMKGQHQLPKNKPLLLVCAVGGRSYGAMQILSRQGYTEIYNLKGGVSAWKKSKLPLVY